MTVLKKYFLPPFFSLIFLASLSYILKVFQDFDRAINDGVVAPILIVFFYSVFGYPVVLIIHLIGCAFIKLMKYFQIYNLKLLLIVGFTIGSYSIFIIGSGVMDELLVMGGVSGLLSSYLYYIFDK